MKPPKQDPGKSAKQTGNPKSDRAARKTERVKAYKRPTKKADQQAERDELIGQF